MAKLYVKALYSNSYAGGREFDGWIIVDDKQSDKYYALFWSKKLAEKAAEFLSKHV